MTPAVSVICSVRDAERYVETALRSILEQTYRDLELIVIDDGSADETPAIVDRIAAGDGRVQVHRQSRTGLTIALNRGLQLARGSLVARQDADDVSLPGRLAAQVRFLGSHPHWVVGTGYQSIDAQGRVIRRHRPPITNAAIRVRLLSDNALAHSSVMFRRDAILDLGGYDESFATAQDYDLWCRIALRGKLANLRAVHLQRRVHAGQVTMRCASDQAAARDVIRARYRRAVREQGDRLTRTIARLRGYR